MPKKEIKKVTKKDKLTQRDKTMKSEINGIVERVMNGTDLVAKSCNPLTIKEHINAISMAIFLSDNWSDKFPLQQYKDHIIKTIYEWGKADTFEENIQLCNNWVNGCVEIHDKSIGEHEDYDGLFEWFVEVFGKAIKYQGQDLTLRKFS